MKKTGVYLIMSIVLFFFSCDSFKEKKEVKQYTIEQFMNTISIGGSSFSFDESKILFSSNENGIYNLYEIGIEGGEPKQLTNREETSYAISYFPTDDRILLRSDQGGNEINHIYLRDEEGIINDLIPFDSARINFLGWSHDRKSFFFSSNKRDARFDDYFEMNLASMEHEMIYENLEGYNISTISNDKNLFAFTKTITTTNNNMYLYNRKTKESKLLSEHEGEITYRPVDFSADGNELYFLTDENSEFAYLAKMDLETEKVEKIYDAGWDIMYAYHSYNGKYRVIGINWDSKTVIKIFDTASGEEIELPKFDNLNISSVNISQSENYMGFYASSSISSSNLYILNLETNDYKQLTNTLNPEINPDDLVTSKVVRYKSFDGLEIPAVLYIPYQASKKNKVPALVHVHGGPGGQARVGYRSTIQYLVNHGYAVIDVNNRGSSGYGKTFYSLDDRKHGDHDLKDCIYAKNFLEETGVVDPDKIGIMGGSYGGYMVAAAMTFTPDEFEVGVNIFGVTNWLRTLKSIPAWWEDFRNALYKEMGNPYEDSVYLYNISPLFHADKIQKPFMVLQGANDPRVLQVESDEIVEKAKANGVPVEYVIFEDEGHGFRKKDNQIESNKRILEFLDKYLKKVEE